MSSDIIYHETIVRFPASHGGGKEDTFLHMSQCGPSNCYEMGSNGRDGRRTRSWQADSFGTEKQVFSSAIRTAGYTEGGGLKIGGASKWVKPESYIRRVRNLLVKAQSTYALEGCSYAGYSLSFSIHIATKSDDPALPEHYDFHEPKGFGDFLERFNAESGFNARAFNYFRVYGPEMR